MILRLREQVEGLLKSREPRQVRATLERLIEKIVVGKEKITIYGSLEKAASQGGGGGSSSYSLDWLPSTGEDTNPAEWMVRQPNIFTRHRVICSVSGCTVGRYARGYCKGHYWMMKRGTVGYGKEPVRGSDGRWATKR